MTPENPKPIIRVDELMTPDKALTEFIAYHRINYLFGEEAIKQIIRQYQGHEFSYYNADVFIDNMYYNLRWLHEGIERSPRDEVLKLSDDSVADVNFLLAKLHIPYTFSIITYSTDTRYLRCTLNPD